MQIEHVAIWTGNLEALRDFYVQYFGARAGNKYVNPGRGFESYFLEFEAGARLEIMSLPNLEQTKNNAGHPCRGYAHIAFRLGSKELVDKFTVHLREAGFELLSGPRTTGDGYYESVILDPDGNQVEITI